MLRTLSVRDVVLIDRLELTFHPRLGVLTGETGAGKSILLDALGLALGTRADSGLVRHGAAQAVVSADFDVPAGHPARRLLAEQGLDGEDDGLILRRIVGADGRSRAFVNDQPVSVGLLRSLGETLVDIHGQFDNRRLLDPSVHLGLLDAFGGLGSDVEKVGAAFAVWRDAAEAHRKAEEDAAAARRDEDFLRHAVDELTKLASKPGEEAELAAQRALAMEGEKLVEAIAQATAELSSGRGVEVAIRAASRPLERLAEKAQGKFDPLIAALDRAADETAQALIALERIGRELDLDPRKAEAVEERLFALRALARKHNVAPDSLAELADRLKERLASIEDGGSRLKALAKAEAAAREAYAALADKLSAARRKSATRLDKAMAGELKPLKLGQAVFSTLVEPLAEADWSARGRDRAVFQVTTNPGTPPGPLARIASGGELSRFMLALKVVLAEADPVSTIVFDEVDSGIGGAVAAAVGERLAKLARQYQVLVVTHSPQVASMGAHHWRVSKKESKGIVLTNVEALGEAARKEEIARMLAGARVTEEARAAADSLLQGRAP
jgi:DNA repair protein RecN (Recombination protein N)